MNKKLFSKTLWLLGAASVMLLVLPSCRTVKVPQGLQVVQNFDVQKYAGTWYEVARFDFKHEKDMSFVTATYSRNDDGTIKVLNKGFNDLKQEWTEKEGKAKFVGPQDKGALKVSFFGPFYAGYNVVRISADYKYALVFGESTDYIWMLSREKTIPEKIKQEYLQVAKDYGYELSRLVWTKQE